MGTTHLLRFPSSVTAPSSSLPLVVTNPSNPSTQNPGFRNPKRCLCAWFGFRRGRPRCDSNAEKTLGTERFRFNIEDGFLSDDEDDDQFSFGSGAKQRVWWSDDSLDDEEGGQFGVLEDSVGFAWIFKVFSAFSWMLPAVIISMLLGTGPSAFLMALALPFAQSALSLAADTLWGRSSNGPKPKPKPRTKKKPFARTATDIGMSKEKGENIENGNGRGTYQSWVAANDASVKKGYKSMPRFGGWDDLDTQGATGKVPKGSPALKVNEARQQKKGKLSKKARRRETPLLLRLLIAVFPILGSWMRLL